MKIEKCPFCGGESLLRDRYINGVANTKHYIRECRHCKATFAHWFRSIKKANEAWNRRADAAPVVRGEWIPAKDPYDRVYCYRHAGCGCEHNEQSAYCPNCGAKMESEGST
jgi:Lar family restriction alleviation protein